MITLEAEGNFGIPAWKKAIDFANPNFAGLACECGGVGFNGDLREVISQALEAEGPAIVDCVIEADELLNLPHIDLEKIENFAEAQIKEAVLAATGG